MPRPASCRSALLLALTLALGSSTAHAQGNNAGAVDDPLEDFNRAVYEANTALDKAVLRPVALGYRAVVPEEGRDAVHNFLGNLREPLNFVNQLLQGDLEGAGDVAARFAINTTLGVGGLFDPATGEGFQSHEADFGQTLGRWGVDSGPYLVLPLLGPSNVRDTVGYGVDLVSDPVSIGLRKTNNDALNWARAGVTVLDQRTRILDELDDVRAKSLDEYATVRSIYTQRREAQVRGSAAVTPAAAGSADSGTATIPDYDAPPPKKPKAKTTKPSKTMKTPRQ